MAETYETKNAYAEYLQSKEWDFFATVTCRAPRKDTLAFIRDYTNIATPPWSDQMRGFVAVEPHRTGMIHIHGLLAYDQMYGADGKAGYHPSAAELKGKFEHVFGWSRVSPINSKADVAGYCAKYVVKETNRGFDYDFIGDWL